MEKILNLLKKNLNKPDECYIDEYHLKEIRMNLFEEPYDGIDYRANSIRSSAAMIYNTIGNNEIVIDGKKYSNIKYEYELPAIDNKDNSDHEHSAHLDVKLEAENEMLFIEAKCLEWFDSPKKLKKAYLSDYCYFDYTGNAVSKFKDVFLCLLKEPQDFNANEKGVNYTRYDAVQMTIHILGIYNWCVQNKKNVPENITLMNVVWNYDCEEYYEEEKEALEYIGFANLTFRNIFKKMGVIFKVEYVRYSDFLNRVDWTDSQERRNYLRRYETGENYTMNSDALNIGLEEKVTGYNNVLYSLMTLRETANKYKWNNPKILEIRNMHEKIYNYPHEIIPIELVEEIYGVDDSFKEIWKKVSLKTRIPYCVSNLGRIATYEREENGEFIEKNILKQTDIKDKTGRDKKGYLVISYENEGNGLNHSTYIYEFIGNAFLGDKKDNQIHHIDNNGYDCRPENLVLLTPRQHSKVHGFFVYGDNEELES